MGGPLDVRASEAIESKPLKWLWEPYLARGKVAVLDGVPGMGKSLLTADLAARLSRGGPLPDGYPIPRACRVVLVSAEDDLADTVKPRLTAAGADLAAVKVCGGPRASLPRLPDGLKYFEHAVMEAGPDLLVIDPLSAVLPRAVAHDAERLREALAGLTRLAEEWDCAVLLIRHDGLTAERGGVSAAARTGLVLAPHPDDGDLRVLAVRKSNLSAPGASLGFRIADGALRWSGAVDLSAAELCATTGGAAAKRPGERAVEFLRKALSAGPRLSTELEAEAKQKGLTWVTVNRAKAKMRVVVAEAVQVGGSLRWVWRIDSVEREPKKPLPAAPAAARPQKMLKGKKKPAGGKR